jgi:predicted nucleic acid-binding protein
MHEIAEGRLSAAIDTEIVQEALYRFGSEGKPKIGVEMARGLLDLVDVVYPVTLPESRLSIELFERYAGRGVTARDALHAAVMLSNRIRRIVSADRHFDQIDGIERMDPMAFARMGG